MVPSTFDSSISDTHVCIDCLIWNKNETKVEKTMVYTIAADDVTRRAVFWTTPPPLILDVET